MTGIQIRKSVLSIVAFFTTHNEFLVLVMEKVPKELLSGKYPISTGVTQEYKTWIMFFYLKTEKGHNHENLPSGNPEKTKNGICW